MSLTHNTPHIKLINMRKLFLTLTLILLCNIGFSQNVIDPKLQEILNKKGDFKSPFYFTHFSVILYR